VSGFTSHSTQEIARLSRKVYIRPLQSRVQHVSFHFQLEQQSNNSFHSSPSPLVLAGMSADSVLLVELAMSDPNSVQPTLYTTEFSDINTTTKLHHAVHFSIRNKFLLGPGHLTLSPL